MRNYVQKRTLGVREGTSASRVTVLSKIEISCFVCDAQAWAFLKKIKAHNSYYDCERCMQEGPGHFSPLRL